MHDATRAYAAPIEHEHVRPGPASQARFRHGYLSSVRTTAATGAGCSVEFNLECKIIKLHSNLRIIFRCVQLFGPLARSQVESNPVRALPAAVLGPTPCVSPCVSHAMRLGDALTVTVRISCSEARSIRIAVGMYSQRSPLFHSSPCS
jgi:hypothetical protein